MTKHQKQSYQWLDYGAGVCVGVQQEENKRTQSQEDKKNLGGVKKKKGL